MASDCLLSDIKGIGPKRAEALGRLGLFSLDRLLLFAPRDYYDLREAGTVASANHGEYALLRVASIEAPHIAWPVIGGRRTAVVTVNVSDGNDSIRLTWFNQPFRMSSVPPIAGGYVHGRVDKSHGIVLQNATFCPAPPGIIPVYPLTKGLSQSSMRQIMKAALRKSEGVYGETLPDDVRMRNGLCQLGAAVEGLHFPVSMTALEASRRRLSFEDVLYFTILLERLRRDRTGVVGTAFKTDGMVEEFTALLPFAPTDGQLRIMREIACDMSKPVPMNRLIQGDVGSGKTAIAIFAMYVAYKNGFQSALMAPTEILAEQHYDKLCRYFGSRCAILRGGMRKSERDQALARIKSGEVSAVVGTHALLEGGVEFCSLGLAITDEQHRFGVRQRANLGGKAYSPDALIMSATPIPRTLSLIMYGDLAVSRLTELPAGRKPVVTRFVPSEKRADMYAYIMRQIEALGVQAFVVCPMIEDSEVFEDTFSAESVFNELRSRLNLRIELLHGRIKSSERDAIMDRFRAGEIDLLVSTTVIEVGVDVPNACIMVVESADRFGLAQLHQLRGRVGRGGRESYCFLLSLNNSPSVMERINTLVSTNDGFEIAEKDLEVRGPGELLGQRQHGLSEFAAARLSTDMDTLYQARNEAIRLIAEGGSDLRTVTETALSRYDGILKEIAIN